MVKKLNRYNGGEDGPGRTRALTLVEVLVILAVIVILAGLFLPASNDRKKAERFACANNLKQIGIAFRTWEGEHDDFYPVHFFTNEDGITKLEYTANPCRHFQVMSNELNDPRVLICPADNRTSASDFASLGNSNLSYFINIDANEEHPTVWLAGDRNLVTNGVAVFSGLVVIKPNGEVGWSGKMHKNGGNVLSSDGSVMLQGAISNTGTNVTRLAVP